MGPAVTVTGADLASARTRLPQSQLPGLCEGLALSVAQQECPVRGASVAAELQQQHAPVASIATTSRPTARNDGLVMQ